MDDEARPFAHAARRRRTLGQPIDTPAWHGFTAPERAGFVSAGDWLAGGKPGVRYTLDPCLAADCVGAAVTKEPPGCTYMWGVETGNERLRSGGPTLALSVGPQFASSWRSGRSTGPAVIERPDQLAGRQRCSERVASCLVGGHDPLARRLSADPGAVRRMRPKACAHVAACFEGHCVSAYEQNTQQSPPFGLSISPHPLHR